MVEAECGLSGARRGKIRDMVNFGGKIMPLMSYRCIAAGGPPPAFSKLGAKTRRALEAKFYAGVNGECIRAEIGL